MPTLISPVGRRNSLEKVFGAAYLDRYVFARDDSIVVHWPEKDDPEQTLEESAGLTVRLSALDGAPIGIGGGASDGGRSESAGAPRTTRRLGRIYGETNRMGMAGNHVDMGHAYRYPAGAFSAVLMPRPREYYEGNMRVTRRIPFWSLDNNRFTTTSAGTYPERRQEALLTAARLESGTFSEMAKMAIDWWSLVDIRALGDAIDNLRKGWQDRWELLLGLLGMKLRFGKAPEFPSDVFEPLGAACPLPGAFGYGDWLSRRAMRSWLRFARSLPGNSIPTLSLQ